MFQAGVKRISERGELIPCNIIYRQPLDLTFQFRVIVIIQFLGSYNNTVYMHVHLNLP